MGSPHAPRLTYNCDDYECCDNGCPTVTCRTCKEEWPCTDWQSRHTENQTQAQDRYVARKWYGDDTHMIEYTVRQKAIKRLPPAEPVPVKSFSQTVEEWIAAELKKMWLEALKEHTCVRCDVVAISNSAGEPWCCMCGLHPKAEGPTKSQIPPEFRYCGITGPMGIKNER